MQNDCLHDCLSEENGNAAGLFEGLHFVVIRSKGACNALTSASRTIRNHNKAMRLAAAILSCQRRRF